MIKRIIENFKTINYLAQIVASLVWAMTILVLTLGTAVSLIEHGFGIAVIVFSVFMFLVGITPIVISKPNNRKSI